MNKVEKKSNPCSVWLAAMRPKTLAAAMAPVLVGIGLAWRSGEVDYFIASIILVCAFLIQIGTNFANDYYDFIKGADTEDRIGFIRATSNGLIRPEAMKRATFLTMFLAFLIGLILVWYGGWTILLIGVLSIIFGIAYTGGPYPLGYNGLGDIFVFIFFGIIAVTGTFYLLSGEWSLIALISSIPIGALSVNILVVNNLRDVEQDKVVGKRTLGVLLGDNALKAEYLLMMLTTIFIPIYLHLSHSFSLYILFSMLPIPVGIYLCISVLKNEHKPKLNGVLEKTAQFLALYSLFFTISLAIS